MLQHLLNDQVTRFQDVMEIEASSQRSFQQSDPENTLHRVSYSRLLARAVHALAFTRDLAFDEQCALVRDCERYRTLDEVPEPLRARLITWAASSPAR